MPAQVMHQLSYKTEALFAPEAFSLWVRDSDSQLEIPHCGITSLGSATTFLGISILTARVASLAVKQWLKRNSLELCLLELNVPKFFSFL